MRALLAAFCVALVASVAVAKIIYREDFDDSWNKRWVVSHARDEDGNGGRWEYSGGEFFSSPSEKGIRTAEDARFYQISAPLPNFTNKDQDLAITYTVKLEQDPDCVGWYLKFGPPGVDLQEFDGDAPYNIMFGPDVCGGKRKVHLILNHKGKNYEMDADKVTVAPETETKRTHAYTMVIRKDKTFAIFVDGIKSAEGAIEDFFPMLAPRMIRDPNAVKPDDWVDDAKIPDPKAKKPTNWDSIPAEIPDPKAKRPADWDDDVDGTWEAPKIPNPKYKGEWKPPMIDNPAYKGEWEAPLVPNPAHVADPSIGEWEFGYVGVDVWQVRSGTIFTTILIGDNLQEQLDWVRNDVRALRDKENSIKSRADEKAAEENRRRMEEHERHLHDDL